MKKLILILLLILIPNVMALEIDRLKVYVNDVKEITLESITEDTDGGTIEDISAGDLIEIQIYFENNGNVSAEIDITAIIEDIDDGDNLKETITDLEIESEEEKKAEINFNVIPSNVRIDDYDMIIEIDGEYENGTAINFEINFNIDVISSEEKQFDLVESFYNLTELCSEYIKKSDEKFDLVDDINRLEHNLGGIEERAKKCEADLEKCNSEKVSCENEKANMITNAECEERIEEQETDWFPFLLIGGGIWYYFKNKKKEEEEEIIESKKEDNLFK